MSEERRVYCKFCEQTFLTDDLERCSLCRKTGGLLDPMSPTALTDLVTKKRPQSDPVGQLHEDLEWDDDFGDFGYVMVSVIEFGILLFFWGVYLIFHSDGCGGLSVAAGGLVFLLLAYLGWRYARKGDVAARAAAKDGHPVEEETRPGP